jgi:uncharacterized protein YhfF
MRDRLNALVLRGDKVATAGLVRHDYDDGDEPIEVVGERQVMLDSTARPLALIEIVRVEVHPFSKVPWEFAASEGEGFESIEDWREGHRRYYARIGVEVVDDDAVVCTWFRLVRLLDPRAPC